MSCYLCALHESVWRTRRGPDDLYWFLDSLRAQNISIILYIHDVIAYVPLRLCIGVFIRFMCCWWVLCAAWRSVTRFSRVRREMIEQVVVWDVDPRYLVTRLRWCSRHQRPLVTFVRPSPFPTSHSTSHHYYRCSPTLRNWMYRYYYHIILNSMLLIDVHLNIGVGC